MRFILKMLDEMSTVASHLDELAAAQPTSSTAGSSVVTSSRQPAAPTSTPATELNRAYLKCLFSLAEDRNESECAHHLPGQTNQTQQANVSSSSAINDVVIILLLSLSCTALVLNTYVATTLIINRQKALRNSFYLIVLHCSVCDLLRAALLIVWVVPIYDELSWCNIECRSQILSKVQQWSMLVTRMLNLQTIFNLLVFTVNEFVVIKHPLKHRYLSTTRFVGFVLLSTLIVSVSAVLLGDFIKTVFINSSPLHRDSIGVQIGKSMDNILIMLLCYVVLAAVLVCYMSVMRAIRQYHNSSEISHITHLADNRSVEGGSVTSRKDSTMRRQHNRLSVKSAGMATHKHSTATRGPRAVALVRHKYLIVIGSVLTVNVLFLIPYSVIQVMQLHMFREIIFEYGSIKWFMKTLIGLQATCQPLCYFRMREFRYFALCRLWRAGGSQAAHNQNNHSQALPGQRKLTVENQHLVAQSPGRRTPGSHVHNNGQTDARLMADTISIRSTRLNSTSRPQQQQPNGSAAQRRPVGSEPQPVTLSSTSSPTPYVNHISTTTANALLQQLSSTTEQPKPPEPPQQVEDDVDLDVDECSTLLQPQQPVVPVVRDDSVRSAVVPPDAAWIGCRRAHVSLTVTAPSSAAAAAADDSSDVVHGFV